MTNDEVFAQALRKISGPKPLNLALPNPYKVLAHQRGLGRECVMVRLLENDVTPYATYELAGEDPEGRRYCVRGEYLFTEMQAIKSIGRRTGTNLEVA
jgi:hypothetical protein